MLKTICIKITSETLYGRLVVIFEDWEKILRDTVPVLEGDPETGLRSHPAAF
jgi:hypothetical protein